MKYEAIFEGGDVEVTEQYRVREANLTVEALDKGYLVRDPSQNGILLTVGGIR